MRSKAIVFISFKSEEFDRAAKLRDALTNLGYSIWLHDDIEYGTDWHGEIMETLKQAGAVIVLWSTKSMLAPWVRHEASCAIARGLYIPVRIENIEIEGLYYRENPINLIIDWNKDITKNVGFISLEASLKKLMPPLSKQITNYLWRQRAAILFASVAIITLILLFIQGDAVNKQIKDQGQLSIRLDEQFQKLSNSAKSQRDSLDSQFVRQQALSLQSLGRLGGVADNLKRVSTDLGDVSIEVYNTTYPLSPLKGKIGLNYTLSRALKKIFKRWADDSLHHDKNGANQNLRVGFDNYSKGKNKLNVKQLANIGKVLFDSNIIRTYYITIGLYKKSDVDKNDFDASYIAFIDGSNFTRLFFGQELDPNPLVEEDAEIEFQLLDRSPLIRNFKQLDGDSLVVKIAPLLGEGTSPSTFEEKNFLSGFGLKLFFGNDPLPRFFMQDNLASSVFRADFSYLDREIESGSKKDIQESDIFYRSKFVLKKYKK